MTTFALRIVKKELLAEEVSLPSSLGTILKIYLRMVKQVRLVIEDSDFTLTDIQIQNIYL